MKGHWWGRVALGMLLWLPISGCLDTTVEDRSQQVRVVTDPPGATVWQQDEGGRQTLGAAPVTANLSYQMEVRQFHRWFWLGVLILAVLYILTSQFLSTRQGWKESVGSLAAGIFLMGFLVVFVACLYGESQSGEYLPNRSQNVTFGASADGHREQNTRLRLPTTGSEIRIELPLLSD